MAKRVGYQWLHDLADSLRKEGHTESEKTTPHKTEKVDMSKFIPKPKTINAVKWDGSPEGAAEVRDLIKDSGYTMDRFMVAYDNEGKLDKYASKIIYYAGEERPKDQDRYGWKEYRLDQGWIIVESTGSQPKTISNEEFKRNYIELGQVTYDDYLEWFGEAT